MTRRSGPPKWTAPQTPAKKSSFNTTSGKQIHLHLARLAGVDVDLILGDLAQMGWTITDDDIDLILGLSLSRPGADR